MTVSYVRKLPREAPPGTKWVYNTSETNLVGVLVAEATGKRLADYLSEKVWRRYGMERDAEWMIDDVGHEQGGCCLAMTLRDSGRFGQFILEGARVDGSSIVPDGWFIEATRTQVSTGATSGYGFQWWTRDDGTFEARGIYGQRIHIDPGRRGRREAIGGEKRRSEGRSMKLSATAKEAVANGQAEISQETGAQAPAGTPGSRAREDGSAEQPDILQRPADLRPRHPQVRLVVSGSGS